MNPNVLWWRHLVWIYILEKLAAQRLFSCAAFAGVQIEHVVKKIEGSWRDAEQQQKHRNMFKINAGRPNSTDTTYNKKK